MLLCGCAANSGNIKTDNNSTTNNTTNVADTTLEARGVGLELSGYDTNAITWGPGNIKDHARPVDPTNLQEKYGELNGKWLLEDGKNVCLTFDEGYENGYTAQILDTLKEKMFRLFSSAPTIMSRIIPSLFTE